MKLTEFLLGAGTALLMYALIALFLNELERTTYPTQQEYMERYK